MTLFCICLRREKGIGAGRSSRKLGFLEEIGGGEMACGGRDGESGGFQGDGDTKNFDICRALMKKISLPVR